MVAEDVDAVWGSSEGERAGEADGRYEASKFLEMSRSDTRSGRSLEDWCAMSTQYSSPFPGISCMQDMDSPACTMMGHGDLNRVEVSVKRVNKVQGRT